MNELAYKICGFIEAGLDDDQILNLRTLNAGYAPEQIQAALDSVIAGKREQSRE